MKSWDPGEYLRFGDERTRPAIDLASRIAVEHPATVMDLGCGPGNSTRVLRRRWPDALIVGLDNSEAMIEAARREEPDAEWVLSGIEEWSPESSIDVVFSNATFQWLPNHGSLVERLFGYVAPGGALAFQIPSADFAPVYRLIRETALEGPWASRVAEASNSFTMETPSAYYDHLAPTARAVDIWETQYYHVLESPSAVIDWIASTGLRPYLAALDSEDERQTFMARLLERVVGSYLRQRDGRVLFPFRRIFVIAYR
jgi:trans-aconitate 2-methyltransferase